MRKLYILLFSIGVVACYTILTSGRCKSCLGPGNSGPAPTIEKDMTITIWSNIYPWSSPRKYSPYQTPVDPRLGYGSNSSTSLSNNMNGKFYCVVKVQNMGNNNWGSQGIKTYTWTSTNNSLVVKVPSNYQFKVSVEFYEACGSHYTDGFFGRSKWVLNSGTTGWIPIMSFNQNWGASGRISCYF
ncbi:MAG: hypothetical protein ABS44_08710 [Chryseobacterium sp. SCN 40-13]|nr:MAG: hypothetical protein ABS44_08710 [Chryseobacterium sp. SCN 40-13]